MNWYFQRRSPRAVLAFAFLLVLLIWILDYATSPYLSTSIFYLLPVGLTSWYLGWQSGLIISIISALAWLVTDISTNPSFIHWLFPFWNASVRLGFFLIVNYALSSLASARERQKELISFVVHDLRAPLGSIMITLQLLRNSLIFRDGVAEDEQLVDLGMAASEQMQFLINSLLDLSRLEGGKMPINHDVVEVDGLLQSALEQVTLGAQRQGVTLTLEMDAPTQAIEADPDLTARVLVNLLSNAINYSPANTTITLRTTSSRNNHVLISVQDEGPGIPAEWQRKAFHKFEQVPAHQSHVSTGSGLGLAFCKMAIEAQGGKIWIEPGPERGTVVSLTLPVVNGEERRPTA